jgi:hypothetical protein
VKTAVSTTSFSPILELRQYTLVPGKRDTLIALFEREFLENQETHGARVIGQFRDLDDPDRFVWFRGFPNMELRKAALETFYDGPIWKAHREAANATMIDSDNVLLLHPALQDSAFKMVPERPHVIEMSDRVIVAIIYYVPKGESPEIQSRAEIARFVTEPSENTFPRLPVRTGENVFVWFGAYPNAHAFEEERAALTKVPWKTDVLRLSPAPRSHLR